MLLSLLLPLIVYNQASLEAAPDPSELITVDDDGPADFTKIQDAIDNATDGDTILVSAGRYNETLLIEKRVILVGEGAELTFIDGNGTGTVISIRETSNVRIRGFTIQKSGVSDGNNSGIFIYNTPSCVVSDCIFKDTYFAINVHSSSDTLISNNLITNSVEGINLEISVGNILFNNTLTNNDYGVSLRFSIQAKILNNIIISNDIGIICYSSTYNTILRNEISSNVLNGLQFLNSRYNSVSENMIIKNRGGIDLYVSTSNSIYRNNFNNTHTQAESDQPNTWDDGIEGNYWSDYSGTDNNHDGIGDTPYTINTINQDEHPLLGMFHSINVTTDTETYSISGISNSSISNFSYEIGPETGNKIVNINVSGRDNTTGFCRIAIPIELMNYSIIVLFDQQEIIPTELNITTGNHRYLYFTYPHSKHTIRIISSETRYLHERYIELNIAYLELLNNYILLSENNSKLQEQYQELNNSHYWHLLDYNRLYTEYMVLNGSYFVLLNETTILQISMGALMDNYSKLQEQYQELNNSHQELESKYSQDTQNFRNLIYSFAATTAVFIVTTVYLSKQAHTNKKSTRERSNRALFDDDEYQA